MKSNYFLALLLGSLSFFSCEVPSKTITIDNPSAEKLVVVLDGIETIEVLAGEAKRVLTKFGKREISVNGGEAQAIQLKPDLDYLLNPTQSTYYVENIYYFFSKSARESHLRYNKTKDTIQVGGMVLNGEFRRIKNQILIPKAWTFGPTEMPKQAVQVQKRNASQDYHMTQKLYREQDLVVRALQIILKGDPEKAK